MSQPSTTRVLFNPLEEGYFDDPYGQYAELRDKDPVHLSPMGMPICFGFGDIRRVLTDTTMSMDRNRASEIAGVPPIAAEDELFPTAVINIDAPDHTRIRRLMMTTSFTPRLVGPRSGAARSPSGTSVASRSHSALKKGSS